MGEDATRRGDTEDASPRGRPHDDGPAQECGRLSVFGDAAGLAVFLGALATVGATWQVGVFITDTYAVANGLVNVAHGHLAVERVYYSLTLGSQPGLYAGDGNLYARNYGQAFLALPVYYALDLLAGVVDLHLLLVAIWALVTAIFCRQLGVLTGRRDRFLAAGSVFGALVVVGSVPVVAPVDRELVGLVALQVVSMAAVAVTALALYRLVSMVRGRRAGVAVGAATVLATPLWFWAAVPKRHALTAAAVATLLYWFAASRTASGRLRLPVFGRAVPRSLTLRVVGYVLVGLVAWVHAFEGLLLLGAYATSDLATVSETSRRALLAIGVATALGFAPFFATNLAVNGNPLEPPRTAPHYLTAEEDYAIGPDGYVIGPDDRSDPPDDTGNASSGKADPPPASDPFAEAVGLGRTVTDHGSKILAATGTAPARFYRTYVRSGRPALLSSPHVNDHEAIDLSLLESHPLFGGLAGALAGALLAGVAGTGRRLRRLTGTRRQPAPGAGDIASGSGDIAAAAVPAHLLGRVRDASPARQTDGFALLVVAGFAVMYFPLLPLISQITVRYLLPAVPALLYLLVRVSGIAGTVEDRPRVLAGSYAAFVAAGLLAVLVGLPLIDPAIGEAMQLHGLVNLCVAGLVAAGVLAPSVGLEDDRVPAVALGLGAAVTTVLVAAMHLAYFQYGTYALPFARIAADAATVF